MGFFVFLGCQRVANSNKVANFCHLLAQLSTPFWQRKEVQVFHNTHTSKPKDKFSYNLSFAKIQKIFFSAPLYGNYFSPRAMGVPKMPNLLLSRARWECNICNIGAVPSASLTRALGVRKMWNSRGSSVVHLSLTRVLGVSVKSVSLASFSFFPLLIRC